MQSNISVGLWLLSLPNFVSTCAAPFCTFLVRKLLSDECVSNPISLLRPFIFLLRSFFPRWRVRCSFGIFLEVTYGCGVNYGVEVSYILAVSTILDRILLIFSSISLVSIFVLNLGSMGLLGGGGVFISAC